MKDSKLNNLLGLENFSEKDFLKKDAPTKRTEVAKDVLKEGASGKEVFNEKPKSKEENSFKQLHNLISLDDFNSKMPEKCDKPTKRTEVAKDVLKEGVAGKEVFNEKPKTKEEIKLKDLNNLLSFSDFSNKSDTSKPTKRTEVAKDVLLEKKKKEEKCDDDCDDKEEEKKEKKGLTPGQKKLPKALQDAILKRQNKK